MIFPPVDALQRDGNEQPAGVGARYTVHWKIGSVPVGGVIISDAIAATFDDRVFPGGLTYSGHPLAAASIVASIDAMKEEGIVENAKRIGEDVLGPGLRELAERHPVIGEVRGLGMILGLELVKDQATKSVATDIRGNQIVSAAGLDKPDYTLEMPYYAALLAELICRARSEAATSTTPRTTRLIPAPSLSH